MHRNPSVMRHQFSQVPRAEIPRSTFDRSHGYKTTLNAGYLVPIFVDEALPGDTFNLRGTLFGRLNTPIYPVMDNMFLDTFFFAVPIRLLWNNWERFNGAQDNPDDSTDFTVPQINVVTGYTEGSLEDYFGLPVGIGNISHSALWHRAYNLIWNEWFRDQNLQDSVPVNKGDGPDAPADYTLLRRGKRHDYFTSCLPWPQKGPGVSIPLGGSAPVLGIGTASSVYVPTPVGIRMSQGQTIPAGGIVAQEMNSSTTTDRWFLQGTAASDGYPDIYADLSQATAATINSLRQAFQIQKIYERDARGGTRYVELLKAHFGVTSPDFRLQRPELLGTGSTRVNISPVPQTSGTAGTNGYTPTPQGNLAAMGTVLANGHGFTHSFTEHCVVIGLACIRADLTYQQGLDRMWSRKTRFDFYWPALAMIGEQAVLRKELICAGTTADDDVWGYQERYAEYRYKPSRITGKLRSVSSTSLDAWHLSQVLPSNVVLDSNFIQENPPIDRVVAVPSEPHFIMDCFFKFKTARPMPVYGVPGLIDHF